MHRFAGAVLLVVGVAARAQSRPMMDLSMPATHEGSETAVEIAKGPDPTGETLTDPAAVPAAFGESNASGKRGLPDAPGESGSADGAANGQTAASTQAAGEPQQTKRILGIVPNFRSVSAGVVLPPQSPKEKFKTGLEDSFDYSAVIFVGIQAGIAQATKSYPAFHQGAAGYARYYWHTFADQADENLLVESILPTVTHEDSRYYTLGHGGFVKRSIYAATRIAITRKDDGEPTVNVSEIVGAGAAAGISSAYYPGQYYTWTKTGQRWLTNLILDGATLYVKEFWPDINRKFSHQGGE